jgi:hypothetical protein
VRESPTGGPAAPTIGPVVSPGGPTYASAFVIADRTAAWGQQTHLRLTRLELGLLILAAASGLVSAPIGDRHIDLGGLIAVILFALTLALRAYRMSTRPTRIWQDGRAAAESIKTLCWRYAAGSRLFPPDMDDAAADRLFVERLTDVLGGIRDLPTVQQTGAVHEEITPWMRQLRAAPLDTRRTAYERDRIDDQQHWYAVKSEFNRSRSERWSVVVLALEFVGVVVGAIKAFDLLSSDSAEGVVLALVATVGAAAAAWVQAKQYATLASAYAIANEELAAIRVLTAHVTDETSWTEFVDSAEAAISREHTMWRASRTA